VLLRPHERIILSAPLPSGAASFGILLRFNRSFEWLSQRFGRLTGRLIRLSVVVIVAYAGLTGLTAWQFSRAPTVSFRTSIKAISSPFCNSRRLLIGANRRSDAEGERYPDVDSGCLLDGCLRRFWTGADVHTRPERGRDLSSVFNSFQEREPKGQTAKRILATINQRLAGIEDAFVVTSNRRR